MRSLRRLREQRQLSQIALARLSGIRPETISRIENGHHVPSIHTLQALARALQLTPDELMRLVN